MHLEGRRIQYAMRITSRRYYEKLWQSRSKDGVAIPVVRDAACGADR
jgi:hypothetical protein